MSQKGSGPSHFHIHLTVASAPFVEERLSQLMLRGSHSESLTRVNRVPVCGHVSDSGRAVLTSPHEPSAPSHSPPGAAPGLGLLSLNPVWSQEHNLIHALTVSCLGGTCHPRCRPSPMVDSFLPQTGHELLLCASPAPGAHTRKCECAQQTLCLPPCRGGERPCTGTTENTVSRALDARAGSGAEHLGLWFPVTPGGQNRLPQEGDF